MLFSRVSLALLAFLGILHATDTDDADNYYSDYDAFNELLEYVPSNETKRDHGITLADISCEDNSAQWKCRPGCAVKLSPPSGLCHLPTNSTQCFGVPIQYPYLKYPEKFPRNLAAFSLYPKCWGSLAPLICYHYYRPCGIHELLTKQGNGHIDKRVGELWMITWDRMCIQAYDDCGEVRRFLPKWLKCDNLGVEKVSTGQINSQTAASFSGQCRLRHESLPLGQSFNAKNSSCTWPFVYRPIPGVYDNCHLPCRLPQYRIARESQQSFQMCISFAFFFTFLLIALYLRFFSVIHSLNIVVFCIEQALLSASVYFFIWFLGSFDLFANIAECSSDGLRNIEVHELSWCSWQALITQVVIFAAFLWLALHFTCTFAFPQLIREEKVFRFRMRNIFMLGVYGVSMLYMVLLTPFIYTPESDGISGVCSLGLAFSSTYIAVYLALLLVFAGVVPWALHSYVKKCNAANVKATERARLGFDCYEDAERLIRYRYLIQKQMNDGIDPPNEPTIDELAEVTVQMIDGMRAQGYILRADDHIKFQPSELPVDLEYMYRKNLTYLTRVKRSFKNTVHGWMSSIKVLSNESNLVNFATEEYARYLSILNSDYIVIRQTSMSEIWSCGVIILAFGVLISSLIMQPIYLRTGGHEGVVQKIQTFMSCGFNRSLADPFLYGTSVITNNLGPYEFGCDFEPLMSNRAFATIVVLIVFPALPFIALAIAFFAGLSGSGGMTRARESRRSCLCLCRKTYSRVDDEQLVLTEMEGGVKHAGDSHSTELTQVDQVPNDNVMVEQASVETKQAPSPSAPESSIDGAVDQSTTMQFDPANPSRNLSELYATLTRFQNRHVIWDEHHQHLIGHMRDVASLLQQSYAMVRSDQNLWPLSLDVLTRLQNTLQAIFPQNIAVPTGNDVVDEHMTNLLTLHQQVNSIIPQIQTHLRQISSWGSSMQRGIYTVRSGAKCLAQMRYNVRGGCSDTNTRQVDKSAQPAAMVNQATPANAVVQNNLNALAAPLAPAAVQRPGPAHAVDNQMPGPSRPVDVQHPGPSRNIPAQQKRHVVPSNNDGESITLISVHTESYSAAPDGVLTRLTEEDIAIRAARLREIMAERIYPQEILYVLMLTGDVRPGSRAHQGENHITPSRLRTMFGSDPRVMIPISFSPMEFLRSMRRRAANMVAAIGFSFQRDGQRPDYNPPRLPPLGMAQIANENVMERLFGAEARQLFNDFMRRFDYGNQPIDAHPEENLVAAFTRYMDEFCAERGYPVERDEFVPDPMPSTPPVDIDDVSVEDEDGEDEDEEEPEDEGGLRREFDEHPEFNM